MFFRVGGCAETKTVCKTVKWGKIQKKMQPSIQCRAWGTIKFSKNVNNFLSTNPTTLILSSLMSEFWQRIQIWNKNLKNGGGGGGGEGGSVVEKRASSIGK